MTEYGTLFADWLGAISDYLIGQLGMYDVNGRIFHTSFVGFRENLNLFNLLVNLALNYISWHT